MLEMLQIPAHASVYAREPKLIPSDVYVSFENKDISNSPCSFHSAAVKDVFGWRAQPSSTSNCCSHGVLVDGDGVAAVAAASTDQAVVAAHAVGRFARAVGGGAAAGVGRSLSRAPGRRSLSKGCAAGGAADHASPSRRCSATDSGC